MVAEASRKSDDRTLDERRAARAESGNGEVAVQGLAFRGGRLSPCRNTSCCRDCRSTFTHACRCASSSALSSCGARRSRGSLLRSASSASSSDRVRIDGCSINSAAMESAASARRRRDPPPRAWIRQQEPRVTSGSIPIHAAMPATGGACGSRRWPRSRPGNPRSSPSRTARRIRRARPASRSWCRSRGWRRGGWRAGSCWAGSAGRGGGRLDIGQPTAVRHHDLRRARKTFASSTTSTRPPKRTIVSPTESSRCSRTESTSR